MIALLSCTYGAGFLVSAVWRTAAAEIHHEDLWQDPGPFFACMFWPLCLPFFMGTQLGRGLVSRRKRLEQERQERERILNTPIQKFLDAK